MRRVEHAATRIAFAGLGRMGLPMCERLARAGFAVVATDLSTDARDVIVRLGVEWAPTVAAAASSADVVVTVLPGPGALAAVTDELVGALSPGTTWIDMTTGSASVARDIAAPARSRGIHTLDAPVAGGPDAARDGRLVAFVGGTTADVKAQSALLEVLCAKVLHVGPGGAGYTVKLLVNLLWFGQAIATAEALTLGERAGIDPDLLRSAVDQSAAASGFVAHDADALLAGNDLTSFGLARCCEELQSALALGRELGVPLELAATVADVHDQALAHYGDVDGELLGARFVAERAGVSLRRG
jgi:3-hydroxyisobutyrate dehydrogenase-like beta-hydroxyacid dehydrogenase